MARNESVSHQLVHFDIDRYLNPWIPANKLSALPKPVSRLLGFRAESTAEIPALYQWPITFVATVAGLCLTSAVLQFAPGLHSWNPPVIIASLGASAVLDFNAIRAPLAQPRNAIIGNTLSAIVGVAITKLFLLSSNFDSIAWAAGAIACASASFVMSLTNTVHPPGGATALLTATNTEILRLGWRFVPLVLMCSSLLLGTALLFNNILRQYPLYWWSPAACGQQWQRKPESDPESGEDSDGNDSSRRSSSTASSQRTLGRKENLQLKKSTSKIEHISIYADNIRLPPQLSLTPEEVALLERLRNRLATNGA